MSFSGVSRLGLAFGVAATLAGCIGGQRGVVPSIGAQPSRSGAWMDGDLKDQDLLYVSNADGVVNVYKYWTHGLVGVLTKFTQPAGACVDRTGDVYIVDYQAQTISEYAHGGTKSIRVIKDSYSPLACAVDRTSGNLAVANYGETYPARKPGSRYGGNLAIYAHGKGQPTYYGGRFDHFSACGYDDRGDLLASAQNGYSGYYYGDFAYLPKNSKSILSVTLPNPSSSSSWDWGFVNGVTYDGKYWVVDDYMLYRYTIDIKAQYIDSIVLSEGSGAGGIAVYRKTPKSQATQVVSAIGDYSNTSDVGYWKYPAGGDAYYKITSDLDKPDGVAISLKR